VDLKYGITNGNTSIRNMQYVWLANFCGNPAISFPVGYAEPAKGKGRIPVGLMAMGERGAEDQLLDWGRECEGYSNELYPGGRQRLANWEDVVVWAQGKDVKANDVTNGV
jgi:Amidase